ncbi:MAG: phenylacetate--CoA ligase family protein [Xanthomonadales bacterium]|nr:phenylacetate--CoA ligase family protein [Xanthomonadales bacterium]
MLKDFARKIYGNFIVMRHLSGQKRVPYLPQEKWQALRDARVRAMVRHAAATVPHYRDLFRTEGIDPHEIRSATDLDRLPLLDKATIWQAPQRFLSESYNVKNALPLVTSGSAGKPLTVYHDHDSLLANIAFGEREREVLAQLCGRGVRWREVLLLYTGSTFGKVLKFYQQATFIPLRPDRLFLSLADPIEQVVEAINRFRPDVIIGYSGYLEMLFRTLAARSMQMHLPRLVVYGGEAMTEPGREFIRERFGVTLTSLYNAVESFKIGFACEVGNGYHLHADLCHVKLVDSNGKTVADGEKGEVVISNLVNRATVLLNYRLGDVASRVNRKCACGRTLPLLGELEGRLEDIIVLPDGSFVHPLAIWGVFKGKPEVLRYQLIQHATDRFELRLVTTDPQTYQCLLPTILEEFRLLLGNSANIEVNYYQDLKAQGPGKFRAVISACHKNTA